MVTESHERKGGAAAFAALTLLLLVLASMPPKAIARSASFHNCGDIPSLTAWDVRAKRVKCGKAKKVVHAYVAAVGREGGYTQDVMGFHCKITGYYGDGAYYRCASSGHRIVRFTRGG